jgi:hypothetical protein
MSIVAAATIAALTVQAGPADASTVVVLPTVPAQQPPLTMSCASGQVDINHASLASLQTLPAISGPTAQRIVAARPHDRIQDLLAVPGVGPGTLAVIQASGKACSTPLTFPPPAADVCTKAGQTDTNDPASHDALAALFGRPIADRVVATQPFPDLNHVLTVLTAGAGAGKVSKYRSQLCLTPEPKIYNGVEYAWIYKATGGRLDYAGASLVVPTNVLVDSTGDWATITPEKVDPVISGPTFDFTVGGTPWTNGTKQVYVVLPPDKYVPGPDAGTFVPTLVHGSGTDQEELFGNGVAIQSDGRVAGG